MKQAPLIRFRIDFTEEANIGPGKIALLEALKKYGSLSESSRKMGLSYRRAWLLLDSLNKCFDVRVSVNSIGGVGGGGVEITAFGSLLIERYREVERRFSELGNEYLKEIKARVKPRGVLPSRVPVAKKKRRRK